MKILITGTPGVGKTTASKMTAEELGIEHIELSKLIESNNLYESKNEELNTLIFDEDSVISFLNNYVANKNSFIIDTHSPMIGMDIKFDLIFHIFCDTKILAERLEARNYSHKKIEENIQSEIFNIVGEELDEYFEQKIYKINGSNAKLEDVKYQVEDISKIIRKRIIK